MSVSKKKNYDFICFYFRCKFLKINLNKNKNFFLNYQLKLKEQDRYGVIHSGYFH